jgi:xanthine dehydrogenase YagR molybdenum-binding subunit
MQLAQQRIWFKRGRAVTSDTTKFKDIDTSTIIGQPTTRIDGPLKVTGTAMYTSDHNFPGMLYAVPLGATIANGTIVSMDLAKAKKMPGVVAVYDSTNLPKIFRIAPLKDVQLICDEKRPPMADNKINYYGQHVAVVVAETMEQANAACEAIDVKYDSKTPKVSHELIDDAEMKVEHQRGDAEAAFSSAPHKLDATYNIRPEYHAAIELHSSVAVFDGSKFTLYETTQAVMNFRNVLSQFLGVEPEDVRVITKFLGSGFGGKLWPWTQSAIAAVIARELKRPIKLVLSRRAVFETAGHRPQIEQRIKVSADDSGKLTSLQHEFANHRGMLDGYQERCGEATKYFYSCQNVIIKGGASKRNVGSPTSMRGPGAVPGLFASESALDELAIKMNIDPVELRLRNEPTKDEGLNLPFASRHLVECYKFGAEKFGWKDRTPAIGSMKRDGKTVGWGVAGAAWIAERVPAEVSIELKDDGKVRVLCGTQDIGTGTYTVLAQMVAHELGVPLNSIEVLIGDSSLPPGPFSGGSMATGSLIPAVVQATQKVKESILSAAEQAYDSPFSGIKAKDLQFTDGKISKASSSSGESKDGASGQEMHFAEFMRKCSFKVIAGRGNSTGTFRNAEKNTESRHSYGAQFVEITWQKELARLRVSRVLTVIDGGKIINPKSGRNQIEGSIVMGIGMAMLEGGHYEPTLGAPLNSNFADYMLPVHADIPDIDVHFLEFPNTDLNSYGARGIGEIGLAGIAPAIASAVYHATGVRVRDIPIRIEDLI